MKHRGVCSTVARPVAATQGTSVEGTHNDGSGALTGLYAAAS